MGYNLVSGDFGVPIERLADFRGSFDEKVAELGVSATPRISTQRHVYVTKDESEIPEIVEHARWNMRVMLSLRQGLQRVDHGRAVAVPFETEPTTEELLERYFVVGTPDTCIQRIQALQEVMGIDHFNASCWFGDVPHDKVLNSMRLFSEEVMPAFR